MRVPFVAGNWKMNGDRTSIARLLDGILAEPDMADGAEVVVCPPYVYLPFVRARLEGSRLGLGAQDVCEQASGAYTGEVAAPMLIDTGCRYVIAGHSERRRLYGETDALVAVKTAAARAAGLTPIVCVGERLEEREADRALTVVGAQLEAIFAANPVAQAADLVIAYEPVWAIGTGRTARPDQAEEVHAYIRGWIGARDAAAAGVRVVYGGSVTAQNAGSLFAMPNVDGGLIGAAALKADAFGTICRAVRSRRAGQQKV
jgi:triosephosphate isomerase